METDQFECGRIEVLTARLRPGAEVWEPIEGELYALDAPRPGADLPYVRFVEGSEGEAVLLQQGPAGDRLDRLVEADGWR